MTIRVRRKRRGKYRLNCPNAVKVYKGRTLTSNEVAQIANDNGWSIAQPKPLSDSNDVPWWTPEEWEAGCRGIAAEWRHDG